MTKSSQNRTLTAFGKTQDLNGWAKEIGVSPQTILDRLNSGWTLEQALSQTTYQPPLTLIPNSAKVYTWPVDVQPPRLDENGQSSFVYNTLGDDGFVRSIEGLAVKKNGQDLLCYGRRTMTVGHLPDDTGIFRGRVSLEGKGHRATTARIKVQFSDGSTSMLDVLLCQ